MIGIMLDNKRNGTVGDAISPYLKKGNKVSIMASLFSIHAYDFLKSELNKVESVKLLLSEAVFMDATKIDKQKTKDMLQKESFLSGTTDEYFLRNNLNQAKIARECAEWVKEKVEVRTLNESTPGFNLYISQDNENKGLAIQGTSTFTAEGLGFVSSSRLHVNTSISETADYIKWFDEIWLNKSEVAKIFGIYFTPILMAIAIM